MRQITSAQISPAMFCSHLPNLHRAAFWTTYILSCETKCVIFCACEWSLKFGLAHNVDLKIFSRMNKHSHEQFLHQCVSDLHNYIYWLKCPCERNVSVLILVSNEKG